jgi:hypothetical protein
VLILKRAIIAYPSEAVASQRARVSRAAGMRLTGQGPLEFGWRSLREDVQYQYR